MSELEILNNILVNEVYKNKVLLEIELDKVDNRLSIGLLTELLIKDGYEADKDLIRGVLSTRVDDNNLTECYDLFIEKIVEFRKTIKRVDSKSISKALTLFKIMLALPSDAKNDKESVEELFKSEEFVNELKSSTREELAYFKELLLSKEEYELLAEIDKVL